MAAKKNNPKREARMAKNNRNLNSALTIFTAGFIAEFYLLLINAYYVKGTVDQLVAVATYLEIMTVVGAAVLGAGIVLTAMRKKWMRFETLGKWLLGVGAFLAVSSYVMRKIYPAGTTAMCVLIPVVMLLSVVLLLYQHEFTVQAVALTVTIAASTLLSRSGDVLSGITAALCAQLEPEEAVPLAVYLHSRAGDLAAERYGEYSMTPGDIISLLPEAFSGS